MISSVSGWVVSGLVTTMEPDIDNAMMITGGTDHNLTFTPKGQQVCVDLRK